MQRFVKAGPGPVTIEPLAVFGPDGSNPVVRMGWYPSGNAAGKNELFTVSNTPVSNAQTLNVPVTGTTQFDPGSAVFGLYSVWPFFSNREIFSEDALNTFTGAIPHHVRVYPLRTSGGQLVPNSYIVTTEESTSGFDYNDVVYEIDNVAAPPSSSGAEIGLTNLDGAPARQPARVQQDRHVELAPVQHRARSGDRADPERGLRPAHRLRPDDQRPLADRHPAGASRHDRRRRPPGRDPAIGRHLGRRAARVAVHHVERRQRTRDDRAAGRLLAKRLGGRSGTQTDRADADLRVRHPDQHPWSATVEPGRARDRRR